MCQARDGGVVSVVEEGLIILLRITDSPIDTAQCQHPCRWVLVEMNHLVLGLDRGAWV